MSMRPQLYYYAHGTIASPRIVALKNIRRNVSPDAVRLFFGQHGSSNLTAPLNYYDSSY